MGLSSDAALIVQFIDRLPGIESLEQLKTELTDVLASLGFNRFIMTRLPASNERDAENLIIAHTWSQTWGDRYRSEAFFWHDPVTRFSLSHDRPFTWAEARERSPKTVTAARIASEARGEGLVDGLGFPMRDRGSMQSVVSLASDRVVDLPQATIELIGLLCQCAERRAVDLLHPLDVDGQLSAREREVLLWVANGKTSRDTADILNISKTTVDRHLDNARGKLGTANTVQTVSKALMRRIITL